MHKIFVLMAMLLGACQSSHIPVEQAPPLAQIVEKPTLNPDPPPAPPKPRFVVATIMDLAPDTLRNILGAPRLKRTERDAEVWLYRNGECAMHLYFYPNDNGDYRLNYVETEATDPAAANPTVSPNACLDSFVTTAPTP